MFRYSVVTFGCRVNQADSLGFEEALLARGGVPGEPREAALVVVNTCSVTAAADQGARQTIRRIARLNPDATIVVTGCYATRRPDELADLPGVIHVVPNELKDRLLEAIDSATGSRFIAGDGACGSPVAPGIMGRTAYTVRVQTGCEEHCSYCIIPSTRGRSRSRHPDEVLGEIERIVRSGFKEVALTGVHLGSYGRDLNPSLSLVTLLHRIAERAPENVLLRISSLEPMDCSDDLVDLVATAGVFAPHFHLPLQHASDRMLDAMERPYTLERYERLVDRIRDLLPDASIGSDVIVGFPGESPADAELLNRYLESCPLTHLHVFPYSDRPGTSASAKTPKVNGTDIRQRAAILREQSRTLAERFHRSQAGKVRRALTIDDGTVAVTDNYLKIRIPAGQPRNEWVRLEVPANLSSAARLLRPCPQAAACTD